MIAKENDASHRLPFCPPTCALTNDYYELYATVDVAAWLGLR